MNFQLFIHLAMLVPLSIQNIVQTVLRKYSTLVFISNEVAYRQVELFEAVGHVCLFRLQQPRLGRAAPSQLRFPSSLLPVSSGHFAVAVKVRNSSLAEFDDRNFEKILKMFARIIATNCSRNVLAQYQRPLASSIWATQVIKLNFVDIFWCFTTILIFCNPLRLTELIFRLHVSICSFSCQVYQ